MNGRRYVFEKILTPERCLPLPWEYICSAQSRNGYNSGIVPAKVGILTLPGNVRILTWHGSIPELSLPKVRIGTN